MRRPSSGASSRSERISSCSSMSAELPLHGTLALEFSISMMGLLESEILLQQMQCFNENCTLARALPLLSVLLMDCSMLLRLRSVGGATLAFPSSAA